MGVESDFDDLFSRRMDFQNAWGSSFRHQLNDLADFNTVFGDVMRFLRGVLDIHQLGAIISTMTPLTITT